MKIADWKRELRERGGRSTLVAHRFIASTEGRPKLRQARVISFPIKSLFSKFTGGFGKTDKDFASRGAVDAETMKTIRELGHEDLVILAERDSLDSTISLRFCSGTEPKGQQYFTSRFAYPEIQVILVERRESQASKTFFGAAVGTDALYDACAEDMKMLRGWPSDSKFRRVNPESGSVHGIASTEEDVGRPASELLFQAEWDGNGEVVTTLPIWPGLPLVVTRAALEGLF